MNWNGTSTMFGIESVAPRWGFVRWMASSPRPLAWAIESRPVGPQENRITSRWAARESNHVPLGRKRIESRPAGSPSLERFTGWPGRGVAQLASSWGRSTRNFTSNVDQSWALRLHQASFKVSWACSPMALTLETRSVSKGVWHCLNKRNPSLTLRVTFLK